MTREQIEEIISKLQSELDSMPVESNESATTTDSGDKVDTNSTDSTASNGESLPEINSNDEAEEPTQIEPQTNGAITDDVTPKVNTTFEESTNASEVIGTEQVLEANVDQRFATMQTQITEMKIGFDKMQVALAEILTRIELVQEVTDKVTTVDHDSLLTESIRLLV
jgi:hypothetical protein